MQQEVTKEAMQCYLKDRHDCKVVVEYGEVAWKDTHGDKKW